MPAQVISAHKANCCFGLSSLRGTAANFRSTKTHEVVCRRSQLSQRLASTRVPTSHGKKKKLVKLHFWAIENFAVKHLPVARGYSSVLNILTTSGLLYLL